MSKFTEKYNHSAPKFTYELPEGAPFESLKGLYNGENNDNKYVVLGLYINKKSKFGDAPVAVSEGMLINLPSFMVDTVNEMLEDSELIDAINRRKLGLEVYEYSPKDFPNKKCYSCRWIDM